MGKHLLKLPKMGESVAEATLIKWLKEEGDNIEIFFNDVSSPALIKDPSDFDSIYVIMPMKG